jgi:hypothetical protein
MLTLKALLILVAICFSVNGFAQDAALPKVGNKSMGQVKPKGPGRLQTRRNGQGHQTVGR